MMLQKWGDTNFGHDKMVHENVKFTYITTSSDIVDDSGQWTGDPETSWLTEM